MSDAMDRRRPLVWEGSSSTIIVAIRIESRLKGLLARYGR